MGQARLWLMAVAAASCGLFALSQTSSALSAMPEMDAACFSQCLDRALHDVANPSSAIIAVASVVIAAAWSLVVPAFAPRFDAAAVLPRGLRRRGPLQQRRE